MKRYLIRTGMTPFENVPIEKVIVRNLIGHNSGNLIYQSSVMRALMTEDDMEFVPDRYMIGEREADWVNENCDAYIIPLADTFRPATGDLKRMTRLMRRLKIPCVVVGSGLRCELDQDPLDEHPFDKDVRAFIDAALERSATIGLRGHTTASYLTNLGYHEGEHFRVIGCPSIYWNGATLPRKELALTRESRINVTMNVYTKSIGNGFLLKVLDEYPNSFYTAQPQPELCTLYLAEKYSEIEHKDTPDAPYPRHITDSIYTQDRVRFFLNVGHWMEFLSSMDLSIGGRMHGNVAAIQAGCPTAFIVKDRRMSELVDYHHLPYMLRADVDNSWHLEEFLERIDMDAMYAAHGANFDNYVRFLDENGLDHIFRDNPSPTLGSTPFDRAIAAAEQQDEPTSAAFISAEELAARWRNVVKEETAWRKEQASIQLAKEKDKAAAAKDKAVREAVEQAIAERRLKRRIARKLGLR